MYILRLSDLEKSILRILSSSDKPLTCVEIARKLGVDGRKIAGKLRALKRLNYVIESNRKYSITYRGRDALLDL